jgi:predicted naringenin-chalcone synthase
MHLAPEVAKVIEAQLPLALGERDLKPDRWLVHPGGPSILTAVRRAMELDPDSLSLSQQVLWEHGNMSSPTVFFELARCHTSPGDRLAMIAFGPGLTCEVCILRRD